jgi:hypothetical protein
MTRPNTVRAAVSGSPSEPPPTSPRITAAMQVLTDAGRGLQTIRRSHEQAVMAIRAEVSQDPNLTAEGRQARLRERSAKAGKTAQAAIRTLRDDVQRAVITITDVVSANWPKPTGGVEGLMIRQAAWARTKPLLDNGVTASQIIAEETDTETLFVLVEELPAWARIQGANADTMRRLTEACELRIAQLEGASSEADLTALFEARVIAQALDPLLVQAENEALGHAEFGSGLHSAIVAALTRQTALTTKMPITGPDGNLL